ncbi:hypothetical protein ON010_g18275 [Phytophthora cinnamomi]|nr:hypothetical protein ON010_g18275 [Phytophthora cinnamomi]
MTKERNTYTVTEKREAVDDVHNGATTEVWLSRAAKPSTTSAEDHPLDFRRKQRSVSFTLGNRKSQAVTKNRNAVTKSDITTLFWSLAKVVIEQKMEASRIFNVDETVFESAERLRIIFVCLPAIGTHLLQPLDVAVFAAFKLKLKALIDNVVIGRGEASINKAKTLQLTTLAWASSNVEVNISSGFLSCGIYPLSMAKMGDKLVNFQRNDVTDTVQQAGWLRVK